MRFRRYNSALVSRAALLFLVVVRGYVPSAVGQAVYVPNYTSNNISAYLVDPTTGVPTFKQTRVTIEKA